MAHPRQAVIDKIVSLLSGHTDVLSAVYANRIRPIQDDELPCILVYGRQEPVEDGIERRELNLKRNLSIAVEILARANKEVDKTLNDISAQVEEILSEDDTLEWVVNCAIFEGTNMSLIQDGEIAMGSSLLSYTANYFTVPITGEKLPDTP